MEPGEAEPLQVVAGSLELGVHLPEVKAADDVRDPVVPADSAGVLDGGADPRVSAPGHDDQPVAAEIGECRIVQQAVFPDMPVGQDDPPGPGKELLERDRPLDLPEEEEVGRQLNRRCGQVDRHDPPDLVGRQKGADGGGRRFHTGEETVRVCDEPRHPEYRSLLNRLEKESHQVIQPSRVVVVAVGEDDVVEIEEVDLQPLCVPDDHIGVACIEQYPAAVGFDVDGEAVLGGQGAVEECRVVHEDRRSHVNARLHVIVAADDELSVGSPEGFSLHWRPCGDRDPVNPAALGNSRRPCFPITSRGPIHPAAKKDGRAARHHSHSDPATHRAAP